ncbi:MAG: HD domain-containing protein [Deltaproteobacteria bacterium]|nr:HD domain-containing protein [Deltaproteobacteria bacterium]
MEYIKEAAKKMAAESSGSHDWYHTKRVYDLCMRIGKVEGADLDILGIAAYLHDIGRPFQDRAKGRICHAEKGAELAAEILKKLTIPDAGRKNIIHAIRTHRFRGKNIPETIEAKVLFDADKLDSIGAVGIGRAFLFAGEVGATLHNPDITPEESESYSKNDTCYREYRVKLVKVKDRILTKEGLRIALERHAFMESFFERFLKECSGAD